jgi:hypothetical protein
MPLTPGLANLMLVSGWLECFGWHQRLDLVEKCNPVSDEP